MKAGMEKYIEMCIIKTAVAKFQAYRKINSNTTQTQMGKQKEI